MNTNETPTAEPLAQVTGSETPAAGAGWRTVHMGMSIRGALRNRSFKGFTNDDGTDATEDEAFRYLCDKLAAGWEVIPLGECDAFDPVKGCPGHPAESPNAAISDSPTETSTKGEE